MALATVYSSCYTEFNDFFTSHHVYRIWIHLDEEEFFCEREPENKVNRNAIKKITKYEIVVGDFP